MFFFLYLILKFFVNFSSSEKRAKYLSIFVSQFVECSSSVFSASSACFISWRTRWSSFQKTNDMITKLIDNNRLIIIVRREPPFLLKLPAKPAVSKAAISTK